MSDTATPRTLADLKVGDEVAIHYGTGAFHSVHLGTVNRLTATLIILGDGRRFNRTHGNNHGGSFGYGRLSLFDKDIDTARQQDADRWRRRQEWSAEQERQQTDLARYHAARKRVAAYVEARADQPDLIHSWRDEALTVADLRELLKGSET